MLILSGGWLHGFNLGHYHYLMVYRQHCGASKRHVPKNCAGLPVALVMQGIFP